MPVRPPEISYEPYFYPPRDDVVSTQLIFPDNLRRLIAEAGSVRRYAYKGFEPVIMDQLEAHFNRVCKLGLVMPYISQADKLEIYRFHLVHDIGELDKASDQTATDKKIDPASAVETLKDEEKTAKEKLNPDDFLLWKEYEKAKPLLESIVDINPKTVVINPNAILAKLIDALENETYHHTWVNYLRNIYGDEATFAMFPRENFDFSFPRLRKFRRNIVNLNLPDAHMQLAQEIFTMIEAYARVSGQRED